MLPLSRPTLLIIGLAATILASATPASADQKDVNAEILRRKASIRFTTGYTQTAGWEHQLVKGDPNLQHWHWSPMINYNQGYRKVPAGQSRKATTIAERPKSLYIKPTKVALPQRHYDWSYLSKYQRRTHSDVNGTLTAHEPVNAEPAVAKAYNGSYSDVSAKLRVSPQALANKEVNGRLLK